MNKSEYKKRKMKKIEKKLSKYEKAELRDVRLLRSIVERKTFRKYSNEQIKKAWQDFSETHFAGFLAVPDNEENAFSCIRLFLP